MRYSILPHNIQISYSKLDQFLTPLTINILLIHTLGFRLLLRFMNLALQIQGSGHSSKNNEFTESSVEEALDVEPGALMIWSVIERWLNGGRLGRRSCGAESSIGFCCPHSVLSDQAEHTVIVWESGFHCQVADAMPP